MRLTAQVAQGDKPKTSESSAKATSPTTNPAQISASTPLETLAQLTLPIGAPKTGPLAKATSGTPSGTTTPAGTTSPGATPTETSTSGTSSADPMAAAMLANQKLSQQMLSSFQKLENGWMGIGSNKPIGDGSLDSLGVGLSAQYAQMTSSLPGMPSIGSANNLDSLQAPLSRSYGVTISDIPTFSTPLRNEFAKMMKIPGVPMLKPLLED